MSTLFTQYWEQNFQVVDGVKVAPIKNGWAAYGDGWAVHAPTIDEAIARYWQAVAKHQEIAAHPRVIPQESTP
jgi:hypothetical protein